MRRRELGPIGSAEEEHKTVTQSADLGPEQTRTHPSQAACARNWIWVTVNSELKRSTFLHPRMPKFSSLQVRQERLVRWYPCHQAVGC